MTGSYESKIASAYVANLANRLAIGGDRRLGPNDFESHINSSRINQYFLKQTLETGSV